MKAPRLSHWLSLLCCLLGILVVAFAGERLAFIARIDHNWLDYLAKQRTLNHRADADIVIVDIDDYSIERMAGAVGYWPWPRAVHGELIEWLQAQSVKQIAFDISFSEEDKYRPESDQYLGEVLAQYDNIFLPTLAMNTRDAMQAPLLSSYQKTSPGIALEAGKNAKADAHAQLLTPIYTDVKPGHIGSINYRDEADGIARRYEVFQGIEGWRLYSLPALMVRAQGLPLPPYAQFNLDWVGPLAQPFTKISYADIYEKILAGSSDNFFKNKVVFIGSTASLLHDMRPTAIAAQYPGLYMLITAYSNLKHQEQLPVLPAYTLLPLGLLAWSLMALLLFKKLRLRQAMSGAFALIAVAIGVSYFVSWKLVAQGQLLAVNSMAIAAILIFFIGALLQYFDERRAKQHAVDTFGRFLDKRVVEQLVEHGVDSTITAPRSVELTILFSDIRGFTTISETKAPAEVLAMLNAYFSAQVAMIFKHQGTLDKFIGDAVMAFWGAPLSDPDHAYHAVTAALDMSDALDHFKREHNLPEFEIGIGVHSGMAVVGMLGSEQKLEYTAIGDTINLGSRLEGLSKGKARILVSETTRQACGERFVFRALGSFAVKGRAEEVQVYEPLRKPE